MDCILQYIYLRQIDMNYEYAMDIMRTADYLCIDGLVQLCHEFFVDCLEPNNCVTLLQFAEYVIHSIITVTIKTVNDLRGHVVAFFYTVHDYSYFYFTPLKEAAYKYIVKEFTTIAEQSNELMQLRPEEFREIIEDNQLNVKQEEQVWDIILKWVDIDPENRKNDIVTLVSKVRFGLMDSKYFIENVYIYNNYYLIVSWYNLSLL